MTDHDRDRLLMEANGHLARAIRALQDAAAGELRDRAFVLSNDVVRARQIARTPTPQQTVEV
jgi:hypothetical protein